MSRNTDRLKYVLPYQKEWNAEEKAFRDACDLCQATQRKEKSRVTGLSDKVSKLDFEGRAANADPHVISFCNKYPQFVDDLATELYIQARILYSKASKMDTALMVNMAHVILKLPLDSPTRIRCKTIFDQM
uniref:Uncharacterized protein n=1 Tax=viral metagenome TaxID=1070528 RepID=A0A6C0CI78_9ZZZZ